MARLTGEALPCAPAPSCTASPNAELERDILFLRKRILESRVKKIEDRENRPARRRLWCYRMPPDKEFALEVLQDGGVWTIGRAAKRFNKSARTVFRWVSSLGWTTKDGIIRPQMKQEEKVAIVF